MLAVRKMLVGRLLARSDEDDRAGSPCHHSQGDRPDQEPGEATEASRSQYQQLGLFGSMQKGAGCGPLHLFVVEFDAGARAADAVLGLAQRAPGQIPLDRRRRRVGSLAGMPAPDVHQT